MKKIDLVSHVHWDPAWYLPYEQYRITLIPLMKNLLQILETDESFDSFMFDGQIDAIDDYLVLFPEDRPRIEKLVQSGKLIVGPWYIQPEEFLISGETHIRNMLIGMKKAKEYGAAMPITYLCDMVGHIAQMPQLIKGFGMNYFVGWRGILDGKERNEAAFIWQAPDGTQVTAKALTDGYYHLIPSDEAGFREKIDEIYQKLLPYEKGDFVLLMQGADHEPVIENLSDLIQKYNQDKGEEIISHTTLLEHLEKIDPKQCKIYQGEMRAAFYPGTFILTGILTARMSIKYKNEYVSRELERWAEPFSVFNCWITGSSYPDSLLHHAWMKQLKCSFHDCIYGGHVDSVTQDIFSDYKKALEITSWINGENFFSLSQAIRTVGEEDNITVFNPCPWERKNETVDFDYWVDAERDETVFTAFLEDGSCLPMQINGVERNIKRYTGFSGNQWRQCNAAVGHIYHASVVVPSVPGFGYFNFGIRKACEREVMPSTDLWVRGNVCENSFLRVTLKENGCISVFDKQANCLYPLIHQIEESGDKGDHYNYSKPLRDSVYLDRMAAAKCWISEKGPGKVTFTVNRAWQLPECIQEGERSDVTVCNQITTHVTISAYSSVICFKTIIDNQSRDHRYRLYLPTGIAGKQIQSGSQFYVNTRDREPPLPESYTEKPMNNFPQRLFTHIADDERGIAVFSRGFSEYDARENGDVYLTMLRSVSHLSKATNAERIYRNAGPEYPTPGAQEIGLHELEYALYFHGKENDCLRQCDAFYAGYRFIQGNRYEGPLPSSGSYLSLEGEGLMISAIKKAEADDRWIIRGYNACEKTAKGIIRAILPIESAELVHLNEETESMLEVQENKIHLSVGPYKIFSVALRLGGMIKKEKAHEQL